MERYLCIHCHFYQPPRENPWLEAVELQDSAYPYHDWNERITAECYAPNSAARILDSSNRIEMIVNNYSRISFNFGPTLLSWMEDNASATYEAILDADRESRQRFSGHGSALAQAYNHMILPLASRADKYTQVLWGIRDFEHRFGRFPEGMWLPETAADTETLEVLAELGIKFTVLAPHQARESRKLGGKNPRNVEGGKIDPTRAYACPLPSGRTISLFFYDGPISRAVAFEGLLSNGETFANRLLSGFSEHRRWPQLMHIATDGETYGHHHRHGDMALAYALHHIESNNLAKITNYGEYLEKHPPTHEAGIIDNTSWSCVHGVERWKSDCGCNSGMKPGWRQHWRGPLRGALDFLRDSLMEPYRGRAAELLSDPAAARDDYINVVLDRSGENRREFLAHHASRDLSEPEQILVWKLLEMQRHLMLMYTSCGWFFDELSGIETVQVIMYAGRALQLAQDLFGDHMEERFLDKLAQARSNVLEHGDGAQIFMRWVKPAEVTLVSVGAHYAIRSLFYGDSDSVFAYDVHLRDSKLAEAGRARLGFGHANICSRITQECADVIYAALHLGDHNVTAGVRSFQGEGQYHRMAHEASETFAHADLPGTVRVLDRHFEGVTYSLKSLFRDEQRKIVREIMSSMLAEIDASYRQIYENHAPLMRFLNDLNTPMPKVLKLTAEFVTNGNLRRAFRDDDLDLDRIATLLDTAAREKIALDGAVLSYSLNQRLHALADEWQRQPEDLPTLERLAGVIAMVQSLPFEVDLWKLQNVYFTLQRQVAPEMAGRGDTQAQRWLRLFTELGEKLGINTRVPQPMPMAA